MNIGLHLPHLVEAPVETMRSERLAPGCFFRNILISLKVTSLHRQMIMTVYLSNQLVLDMYFSGAVNFKNIIRFGQGVENSF